MRTADLRPREAIFARSSLAVGLMLFAVVALLVWKDGPTEFVATQWYFRYDHGMARRGLVGTLLQWLGADPAVRLTAVATTFYLSTTAILSLTMANLVVGRAGVSLSRLVLAVAVGASVSGFPALAASFGRFDAPIAGLATVAALVVAINGWWAPLLAGGLLTVAVAIHEAALLLVVPWVAAYAYHHAQWSRAGRRAWLSAMMVFALPGTTTVLIALHSPELMPAELASLLFPGGATPVQEFAVGIQYRSLVDNLVLTWLWMRDYGLLIVPDALSIVPVVGASLLALRAAGLSWSTLEVGHRAMFLSAFSPLLLCLIAYDWGRWWSFAGSLTGMTTLVILSERGIDPPLSRALVAALILGLALTALFGGTGSHAFGLL